MTTGTARFDYLDGIRGIAIGAVLSLHWLSWYSPFFHGGSVGVDVFFVLSGFIITTMLWRSPVTSSLWRAWGAFLWRRAVRLYPALLGLVVVSVALYAVVPAAMDVATVAERGGLTLVQASSLWAASQQGSFWLPGLHPFGQSWSLAVEWQFYVLWPVLVLGARSRGWSARGMAAACVGVAVSLYLWSLTLSSFWFYFGPSARFAELLSGAALALWFQARGIPAQAGTMATPAAAIALATIAGYTLVGPDGQSSVYRWVGIPLTVLAGAVLIHTGYSHRAGPVHRLLSHPWLATVGRHSYSLYLWHIVPVLLLAESGPDVPKPVLGVTVVVTTAALTVASYRLLERPFLRARSEVLRAGITSDHLPSRQPAESS